MDIRMCYIKLFTTFEPHLSNHKWAIFGIHLCSGAGTGPAVPYIFQKSACYPGRTVVLRLFSPCTWQLPEQSILHRKSYIMITLQLGGGEVLQDHQPHRWRGGGGEEPGLGNQLENQKKNLRIAQIRPQIQKYRGGQHHTNSPSSNRHKKQDRIQLKINKENQIHRGIFEAPCSPAPIKATYVIGGLLHSALAWQKNT